METSFFGTKPTLIIKGGIIAAAPMGDPNASIPTPQPVHFRKMFGSYGKAPSQTCVTFTSKMAVGEGLAKKLDLSRRLVACRNTRSITKRNMIHNAWMPNVTVDPQTYEVHADGLLMTCEPAKVLPLTQLYNLF